MTRGKANQLPEFMDAVVLVGMRELSTGAGLDEEKSRPLMLAIARGICDLFARQTIYVPLGARIELLTRNARIVEAYRRGTPTAQKFSGELVQELAAQHSLTKQQIYNILRLARCEHGASELGDAVPAGSASKHEAPGGPA